MAISLRSAIGSNDLPMNPLQEDVWEGYSQATASPIQQGWHTASLGGAANSAYTKALMAKEAGDTDGFNANMSEAQALQQEARAWTPEVQDYRQVDSLSSGLRYAAQGLGSAANSSLPSLAGGVAGGIGAAMIATRNPLLAAKTVGRLATAGGGIGAAIPGYDMEMEEAVGQAAQDERIMATRSPGEILDASRIKGGINMLGEAAVTAMLMGKIGGAGLKQAFKSPMAALGAVPGAIGQGMLTEGATEGAQNIVGQMTQNQLRGDPTDQIDYHEATNDAIIGGMFGGAMGTVGGAADLAHRSMATIGQGVEQGVDAVAGSDAVRNAMGKAKEVAGQGVDIISELAGKGMDFVKADANVIRQAYNEGGVPAAMAMAEDMWKRRASNGVDAVEEGMDKLGTKVEEIKQKYAQRTGRDVGSDATEIASNPYDKNGGLTTDQWQSIVNSRGDLASDLVDEFASHPGLTGANKELLTRLSTPEGKKELRKDDKLQAQVGTIWKGLENHDKLTKDLNDIVSDLRKRQEASGKPMPSKQMTTEAKQRRDDVASMLSSVGVYSTKEINSLAKLAGEGKLEEDRINAVIGDRVSDDEKAELIKIGHVLKTDEEIIPAKNRKEKRASDRANAETAQQALSNNNSNYIASNISKYVGEAVAGSEYDSESFRNSVSRNLEELVAGVADGTATHGDILRLRSRIEGALGEKGRHLIDVISGTAEFYSNRMDMKDVAEKIAGLRDRNAQQTTIEAMDKMLANNGSTTERRQATSAVLHELTNAYMDGLRSDGSRDRVKQRKSDTLTLERLRESGQMSEARRLEEHLTKQRTTDPFAEYKAVVKKHFGDKNFDKVETLVTAHLGEIRSEMRQSHIITKKSGGTGVVNEALSDTDINDPDFNQSEGEWTPGTALETDTEELTVKDAGETGVRGDLTEPEAARFYGQSAKEPGKHHAFPGAPLTNKATYDHPQGESSSLQKHIETKNNGARVDRMSVLNWAAQHGKAEGINVETLLNDTAKEQMANDKETYARLEKLLNKGDLSRREGNEAKTHEQVEALIRKQLKAIDRRMEAYAAHRGDGRSFFSDQATRDLGYISTNAGTGKILQLDAASIDRFIIGTLPTALKKYMEKTGGKAETFRKSLLSFKDSKGVTHTLDLAGLITSMVARNQDGDITGVGDKSIDPDFLGDLKVAFANVLGSMYLSNQLSLSDPFNARDGVQASGVMGGTQRLAGGEELAVKKGAKRSPYVAPEGLVRLPGIQFKPDLIIYRDEGTESVAPRIYTYGQVFGITGATAARAEKVSATKADLSKTEIHSALFAKGNEASIVTNVVVDEQGNKYNLNPRAVIKLMMDRHGIDSQTVLPTLENSDGVSAKLAGALMTEGLELLKRSGYKLDASPISDVMSGAVLWSNDNFETNFGSIAKYIGATYKGSFDVRLDKIAGAQDRFINATKKLNKLLEQQAESEVQTLSGTGKAPAVEDADMSDARRSVESAAKELISQQQPEYDKGNAALKYTKDEMENARMNNAAEGATLFDKAAENLYTQEAEVEEAKRVRSPQNRGPERAADRLANRKNVYGKQFSARAIGDATTGVHAISSDLGIRTDHAYQIKADRKPGEVELTAQEKILASQTKADAKRAMKSYLKGDGANLSNKEKAALIKRVNAMPEDSVQSTPAQPVSTNVSTTPYEGPKLSFDKAAGKMKTKATKTRGQQAVETLVTELAGSRTSEMLRADAEHKAALNRKISLANNLAGNKADVTNTPAALGPALSAEDVVYQLESGELTVKQALGHELPAVTEVIRQANKRYGSMDKWPTRIQSLVSAMERNPNDPSGGGSKFSKQGARTEGKSPSDARLQADHDRRLGDTVDMFIQDIVGDNYSGQYTPKTAKAKALVEVSRKADDMRGTLAHEDWHAVEDILKDMGMEGKKIIDTIHAGVQDPRTRQWIIKELLKRGESPTAEDNAFSQLDDPSELAAFAFQFFVENDGKMTLAPKTRSLFEKIAAFVKKLAGIKDDIAKTENFFKFFDTGDFQKNMENPLSVVKGLGETQREQYINQLNEVVKPLKDLAFAAFGHTADRIKAMNIPEYSEILKRFSEGSAGYAGYADEQRARMYEFSNKYAAIVEGLDKANLDDKAKAKINALIKHVESYKKEAGVKNWDMGRAGFPPVFELKNIEGKLPEFKQDLRAYGGVTNMSESEMNDLVNQILYDGYARSNDALFRDNPEKLAKWSSKDQTRQAFAYFKNATQQAEQARAFKGTSLNDLLAKGDAKATSNDKQVIRVFVDASTGRAGMNMSPELRKLYGAVITGINISLLPYALFSQMVEPLQLAFRKNDVSSAVNSAFRGFRDLPRTFNSINAGVRADVWEKAALDLGATTNAAAVNMMSEIMNEVPLRGKLDKLNNMFFRYIGMEQWSRSMHVASTQNALEFIKAHSKHPNKDSSRLMDELGLKDVDVKFIKTPLEDGSKATIELPDISDPHVRSAVLRFVNESMAHPDAASNTVWMNDPRFALLAHLKRFTFGFSYYINRRAMGDIKEGRYKELLPLAMFVPWKLATEALKDFVKPGPEAYKADWGVSEYTADAINKSGLVGRYGVGVDAATNMSHGGSGLEAISPTAEMTGKLARAAQEGHGWKTLFEQVPGGKVVTQ